MRPICCKSAFEKTRTVVVVDGSQIGFPERIGKNVSMVDTDYNFRHDRLDNLIERWFQTVSRKKIVKYT